MQSNWLVTEGGGWGLEELGWGADELTLAEVIDDEDRLLHETVEDADVQSFIAGGELPAWPVPEILDPSPSLAPVVSTRKRARGGDQRPNHGGKGWSTCYACPRDLIEPLDQHNTEDTEEMCEHLAEKRGERWEPSATQLLKKDKRLYEEADGKVVHMLPRNPKRSRICPKCRDGIEKRRRKSALPLDPPAHSLPLPKPLPSPPQPWQALPSLPAQSHVGLQQWLPRALAVPTPAAPPHFPVVQPHTPLFPPLLAAVHVVPLGPLPPGLPPPLAPLPPSEQLPSSPRPPAPLLRLLSTSQPPMPHLSAGTVRQPIHEPPPAPSSTSQPPPALTPPPELRPPPPPPPPSEQPPSSPWPPSPVRLPAPLSRLQSTPQPPTPRRSARTTQQSIHQPPPAPPSASQPPPTPPSASQPPPVPPSQPPGRCHKNHHLTNHTFSKHKFPKGLCCDGLCVPTGNPTGKMGRKKRRLGRKKRRLDEGEDFLACITCDKDWCLMCVQVCAIVTPTKTRFGKGRGLGGNGRGDLSPMRPMHL